mmetsp:Transcript_3337/g.7332  ORF Transcript_3337/g.7332 Transcript_3337/m.7332 type:complete len:86 (-) Transcript_3337:1009-1266(-)
MIVLSASTTCIPPCHPYHGMRPTTNRNYDSKCIPYITADPLASIMHLEWEVLFMLCTFVYALGKNDPNGLSRLYQPRSQTEMGVQ